MEGLGSVGTPVAYLSFSQEMEGLGTSVTYLSFCQEMEGLGTPVAYLLFCQEMEGLGTPVAEHFSVAEAPPCTVISDGVRINLE